MVILFPKLSILSTSIVLYLDRDMMSTKNLLKRLIWWILCAVLSVLCVVLIVGILYSVAGVDVTLKPR
jgi:hypothetical protein